MIEGSRIYPPDPERAARTHAGSVEAFDAMLRRSRQEPDAFWADVASELDWLKPWDTVREGHFPQFKYFVGGVSNPTLNLLDRHLARHQDNRVALIWEGEDGQTRFFTYRMLAAEVNRCANVLKGLGVAKGDGVGIFTPNLAEVMPKTPSGEIMRRLLTEIVTTGAVSCDVTALEDRTAIDRLKALVAAAQGRASTTG